MEKLPLKRIGLWFILLIIGYHVIFGGVRILIDFKYPNGWYDNTIVAFGEKLRILVFENQKNLQIWEMVDTRPEDMDLKYTELECNAYSMETKMGWFYQYKMLYVYGREGFWIIQAEPFHIKLLRNENISVDDERKLDETIGQYNAHENQFTVVNDESDLTGEERNAYAHLKEKAQSRIEELKEQGLYP